MAALFCLVSLWAPWTYVSQESIGGSVSMSPNGFRTVPTSCFITCADGTTSPAAYLLVAICFAAILIGGIWLAARERVLGTLLLCACSLMLLVAIGNIAFLYLATLGIVSKYQDVVVLPHLGAVMGVLSSAGAVVGALVAVTRDRKQAR